ncbi:flavin-containing amine oxidoreductase-domain containing protein [Lophiotrema nucula]|uniref:Flavin-containing amine oxidoreductase-domain containing protein n=1 Tax=Lophiotrema nucula TaxID=690887 RepID=A0A6A5ZHL2_9PLEO|nr:flavin-containing amine oxidoreductase-domain containing protein [Lophiotrema nucula]
MFTTFSATPDADAIDESPFLFGHSHDDLLSISMTHEGTHPKPHTPNTVSMGLSGFTYGQYSESNPSSIHFGDGLSEPSGSHMSAREDRDGSTSSGYVNGQEHGHAPSPLQYPHPLRHSLLSDSSTAAGVIYPTDINSIAASHTSRTPPIKVETPDTHVKQMGMSHFNSAIKNDANKSSTPELSLRRKKSNSQNRSSPSQIKGKTADFRANSSIPAEMSWAEFARQCILAAESSRLNPFSLHPGEYKLLREHITHAQVTIYLNIRNAILRLWTRNPLVPVTVEEACGCAREKRYFGLAKVAYQWLFRNGYINFGCIEVPSTASVPPRSRGKPRSQRTILVVGAGMSGLGCARHLEGLFAHNGERSGDGDEMPPKIIVLEARPRVGGRVYSHPLRNQNPATIPRQHRCTAEMGAQIVTGFEHGNPLNALIRGQLGIPYHGLRDNTILYDHDGTVVEKSQDSLVEKLYNDVLERASIYRNKPATFRTVEGDRSLILFGRDPSDSGGASISTLENSNMPLPANAKATASTTEEKPSSGVEKLAGRAYQLSAGFNPNITAAQAAVTMGWQLKPGAFTDHSISLDAIAKSSLYPTLGQTMDEGLRQYQSMLGLKPKDLRLLNWHHANLEYANAATVNQLSLSGWDQDIGNEFEGEHTEIIGGYQQVPRGLWQCPSKLDIRFNCPIKTVQYNAQPESAGKAVKVICRNGEVFEADRIVLTTPLGVLKSGSVRFDPALPEWKQAVIERMGFGLLNKVILVYEQAFWEPDRDMFGLLNEAEHWESLNQHDYSSRRGRFYLFWNCIKTSGRPTLVALMAGDAAHYAEATSNDELIKEVTGRLKKMFAHKTVPLPSETIVTRWRKDPFACGSYSYVGPKTQTGDYDVMARPHGPLHFAGEATCGTHPATVHGAYLSGLRAASEVVESMMGPIQIPSPLVEKKVKLEHTPYTASLESKRKVSNGVIGLNGVKVEDTITNGTPVPTPDRTARQRDEDYEASIIGAILNEIGERPIKPGRAGVNPFLLYTKDYWYICKGECDESKRKASGDPNAKASREEIRVALGLRWRTESAEIKKPYLDQTQNARDDAAASAASFKDRVATWDQEAARIRREYIRNNPPPAGIEELMNSRTAIELGAGKRLRRI